MPDAAPRHVGHVEEPVDAAEVDEGAVVGDVLHRALEDDALLQHLERLGLERRALALEDRSPGHHHVPARAVELEDGEATALADVAVEVARRPEVGVRAGEERGHADVHLEPALHLADDRPFDRTVALVGLLDLAPDLELLGLVPREDDVARLGVARLEVDVDLVALVHGELAVAGHELVDRDGALGLVADVDRDGVAPDQDDPAGDHLALLRALETPLEEGTKVLLGADLAIGRLRRLGHQGGTPCGRDSCGMRMNRPHILPSRRVFKREIRCLDDASSAGPALAHEALHALYHLLQGERRGVEDDGIGGRTERRVRTPRVAAVAPRELAGERRLVDRRRGVVGVDASLGREHADGAVHRARVDVAEAQAARQGAAGARLSRAGGSVDRDQRPQSPSTAAPSSARRRKKPGNETSAASASAISTPPSAASPATPNAMAMRWSPCDSTRPPRRRRPPVPRMTRPSAVAPTATPRRRSCSSAAMRSLSLTRSSPAPVIVVSPSASAAATQRMGSSSIAPGTSAGVTVVPRSRAVRTRSSARG